jgi:ubiquinone biosynthesis protein
MKLSGAHLKRYRQVARLVWKYGRGDVARRMRADALLDDDDARSDGAAHDGKPEELAADLETMGPTFVKLGQVLSGRPDLLPPRYIEALERLQDKVKPFSFEDVERTVHSELGVRISKAFSSFDPEPVAAASLGQVHIAALRDGRAVVVKVQRPDVRKVIAQDFEVLEEVARFVDTRTDFGRRYRFRNVLDEFRVSIHNELDYVREAQNLELLARNLSEFPLLVVPQPIASYCTRAVLTMERVQGHKITSLSPVAKLGLDGGAMTEQLVKAYLKQVLVDGFFHADPHPGNVFLTDDGRLALLDLGMVGRTSPGMQENLLKLVLAVTEGKSEQAADLLIHIGEKSDEFDPSELRRRVGRLISIKQDARIGQISVGGSLLELCKDAVQTGLGVPSELTLLGKTLLQLDAIGRELAPEFDPNEAIRRHVGELATRRVMKEGAQGNVFTSLLESKAFLLALPTRLGRILDAVANAELELKVNLLDADTFLHGFEKIANRITMGLVLAALIVGAALLMRVETTFRLFGYPGFAMLCFLAAAASGFFLVAITLVQDRRHHKRRP